MGSTNELDKYSISQIDEAKLDLTRLKKTSIVAAWTEILSLPYLSKAIL